MGRRSAGAALEMSVRTTHGGTDECDGIGASIFGRRTKSAGRILGLAPPAADLNDFIALMTVATKHDLRAAEAKRKAAAALEAHVRQSNNAAVADVGAHQADLLRMHAAHATRAAADQRLYIEHLRKIHEEEKRVRQAEMLVASLHEKKAKIAESLRKGGRSGFLGRRSEDNTLAKRQQLEQVKMEIEAAEARLDETRRETEVVKMLRYRYGMQGFADAAIAHAGTTAAIFGTFREVTEYVPAISTQDVMTMNYDGAACTANCVQRLRRDIAAAAPRVSPSSQLMGAASRRRSDNHRRGGGGAGMSCNYPEAPPSLAPLSLHGGSGSGGSTPPPPYTPTAPTMEAMMPQPGSGDYCGGGGGVATVPQHSSSEAVVHVHLQSSTTTPSSGHGHRPSPPRFSALYPKLPGNPYRNGRGVHS